MNSSLNFKIISFGLLVIASGSLLYSYFGKQKVLLESSTSVTSLINKRSSSIMASIFHLNNIVSGSIHNSSVSRRIFTLYDKMLDLERNYNFPIYFYKEVSSTMDKVRPKLHMIVLLPHFMQVIV